MTTRTNLSALALKYSTLTVFFMIALVLAGFYAFFNLGRAEDPPFTIKQMVVSAAWPGATSREVEQQDGMIARFLLGTALFDQLLEPGAIGQTGQGVVQGQLRQFAVGQGQGIGQLGGTRFEARIEDPLRQWKLSPMDLPSRAKWFESAIASAA